MDSGNSASLQSSSGGGGDDEYDSRAESNSTFIDYHPTAAAARDHRPIANIQPPLQHNHHDGSLFDQHHLSSSNFMSPISQQLRAPTSILNLDMVWSETRRSESSTGLFPPFVETLAAEPPPVQPVRNQKKRPRASRRAPTTVLTTDTANFRAMVQEFTGFPSPPPFAASSLFPGGSRRDIFRTPPASIRSTTPLDAAVQPPYLLRPLPHEVVQPPPPPPPPSLSSSLFIEAIIASSTANNVNNSPSTNNISNLDSMKNYQLPPHSPTSELGLFMKNPQFHSLILQTPTPTYPFLNSGVLGRKPNTTSNDSTFQIGGRGGLGEGIGWDSSSSVNTVCLPNLLSSPEGTEAATGQTKLPVTWVCSNYINIATSYNGSNNINNNNNRGSTNATNGKLKSNFHGDKGPQNVDTRGEGMMKSWICSSD